MNQVHHKRRTRGACARLAALQALAQREGRAFVRARVAGVPLAREAKQDASAPGLQAQVVAQPCPGGGACVAVTVTNGSEESKPCRAEREGPCQMHQAAVIYPDGAKERLRSLGFAAPPKGQALAPGQQARLLFRQGARRPGAAGGAAPMDAGAQGDESTPVLFSAKLAGQPLLLPLRPPAP